MYSRFIENKHIIEKESGFNKRNHGLPSYLFIVAFLAGIATLALLSILLAPQAAFFLITVSSLVIVLLGMLVFYTLNKDRQIMHLLELQNALFCGAARTVSDFCIILKYDGTVIYVDPHYSNRFFYLKNQGMSDFDALCQSGKLSEHAKNKLLTILQEGCSGHIEFTVPNSPLSEHSIALDIDPIGIYSSQELTRKLNLAVHPIPRPSGYFFLRSKHSSIEDEYQACMSTFNLGYCSLTIDGLFLSVNKIFAEITGYSKEEIISTGLKINAIFNQSNLLSLEPETLCIQTHLLTKTQEVKPILISKVITKNLLHDTTHIHLLVYAIAPATLEENKDNKKSMSLSSSLDILENSPLATLLLDEQGVILKYNNVFKMFVEKTIPAHELEKKEWNITEWIEPSKQAHNIKNILHQVSINHQHELGPIELHFKNNEENVASLYVNAVHTSYNSPTPALVIGHLIDTTELKNLELHLAHSQKMQAVGQLAGGIAHDFNNLLTAMIGFSDLLLLRHLPGDPSFSNITQIRQNANRAANLVRQLLAFSRKQTLQPKVINITDTLADLSHLIRRLIGENLSLKMIHGRDLGQVRVDQGQLEQVIINLAVNARDAMPQGGTLTLKTSNIHISDSANNLTTSLVAPSTDEKIEVGDYVLIEISDTGHGISKKLLSKIFEPFFSTKETGAGTGLGLSTVYGIIKQTSGYIYVSSTENVGTTFFIFLKHCHTDDLQIVTSVPLKDPALPSSHDTSTQLPKSEIIDLTGRGTILLVEDEAPVRIFSSTALKNKGYTVLEADCAEVALEMIDRHIKDIQIIISDVVMPGMNGPTMIKEILKDHPHIKVIFVSGYGEDEFIRSFGQDRSFHFLAKPYTLQQLATKVKQVMEQSA